MQLVQTRMRLLPPPTFAFTGRRFTFQRRRLMLCAWEMLLPNCGPFPQTSHTCAMTNSRTRLETCTRRMCHAENPAEFHSWRHRSASPDSPSRVFSVSEKPPSDNPMAPRTRTHHPAFRATGILCVTTHDENAPAEHLEG